MNWQMYHQIMVMMTEWCRGLRRTYLRSLLQKVSVGLEENEHHMGPCKGTFKFTRQLRTSDHLRNPFKPHRNHSHQLFPNMFQFLFPPTFPALPHFWLTIGLPIDYPIPVSHPLICIINYFIFIEPLFYYLFTPVKPVYSIYTPPPHLAGLILFS